MKLQTSVLKLLADYRDAKVRDRDPSNGEVAAADLIFVNSSGNPLNGRSRRGGWHPGKAFSKALLSRLLMNVLYKGLPPDRLCALHPAFPRLVQLPAPTRQTAGAHAAIDKWRRGPPGAATNTGTSPN